MDVHHVMRLADDILHDPLRSKLKGLFTGVSETTFLPRSGERHVCAGDIVQSGDSWLDIAALQFIPGTGFACCHDADHIIKVHLESPAKRSIRLSVGVQVLCAGVLTRQCPGKEIWLEDATISFRPEFVKEMEWTTLHLYAGAFSGWSQAMHWLHDTQEFVLNGQEIFIDVDDMVMQVWSLKNHAAVLSTPIAFDVAWVPSDRIGVCGRIQDPSISNLVRAQCNLLQSMSPPCQSWSRGGKQAGIGDPNGFSFLEALSVAARCQSNVLVAECADEIVTHQHWPFLQEYARILGYKMVFSQATPLHTVVQHNRTRWLGVWVRADHQAFPVDFVLTPTVFPRPSWGDQVHELRIPSVWNQQLKLRPSECEFYDRIDLLPPIKRQKQSRSGSSRSCQGLWARVADPSELLPTLCASYTRQHLLQPQHIQNKGIFAVLQHDSQGFRFLSPGMFVSMFGAIDDQALPSKIHEAFHILGNAITVPHSILTIAVAFLSITGERIDPLQLVRQAWAARLTAHNTVVFHQGDFVHFVRNTHIHQWMQASNCSRKESLARVKCSGHVQEVPFDQVIPGTTEGAIIGQSCFQGPLDLINQIALVNVEAKANMQFPIQTLAGLARDWDIFVGHCKLGICHLDVIASAPATEVIEISPTLPFEPEDQVAACLEDGPEWLSFVNSDFFRVVQAVIETLQDDNTTRRTSITIIQQASNQWTSVKCSGCDAQHCIEKCSAIQDYHTSVLAHGRGTIIALLQHEQLANRMPLIVVDIDQDPPLATIIQVKQSATVDCPVWVDEEEKFIQSVNGQSTSQRAALHAGDFISCHSRPKIFAGGHHANLTNPPSLPAGSTLTARLEFMSNTHGWMASDEMYFYTQDLMWMQQELKFSPPVMWEINKTTLDETGFGEPCIFNNATTVIPIMIRAHWGAAEITKRDGRTFVTLVQVHEDFRQSLIHIITRLIDIPQERVTLHYTAENYQPHLCGWNLMMRWYSWGGHHLQIDDISAQFQPDAQVYAALEMAMQCSIEDWRQENITPALGSFAHRLRKRFLLTLARFDHQGRPINICALNVTHPSDHAAAASQSQPIAVIDPVQQRRQRIELRLDHFREYSGWLASDELDYALEGPRALCTNTLFCAPATWNTQREELVFLNDIVPDYSAFRNIFWMIIVNNHWILKLSAMMLLILLPQFQKVCEKPSDPSLIISSTSQKLTGLHSVLPSKTRSVRPTCAAIICSSRFFGGLKLIRLLSMSLKICN